jgi:guanine nucleotide-binding protein G(i) subunit alpha
MEIIEKFYNEMNDQILMSYEKFTSELQESIINIWKNKYFKMIFNQYKNSIHISDGSEYFLNKLEQCNPKEYRKYIIDINDILNTRRKTTGITEYQTKYGNVNIIIYDVGGQRNERKVIKLFK